MNHYRTKNEWRCGYTRCTGNYCGHEISGLIVDSMSGLGCTIKIALDKPIIVYGELRGSVLMDPEDVRITQ